MPGTDVETFLPLIYEAALHAERWPALLRQLVGLMDGHCGSFICRHPDGSGARWIETGFDPRALEQFSGYFASRNVLLQRGLNRPAGDLVSDQDVLPKEEFRRTEYYNDLLLKQEDTNSVLTAFLWRDRDKFMVLNCNRSPRQPEFGPADKDRLRWLMPHLARAIEISLRLGSFANYDAAVPIDRALHAVLVVDEAACVIRANPAGERLLAEQDGLGAGPNGLTAANPARTAALRAVIARAAGGIDGGAALLARPKRGRPLYAIATPLPAETGWLQPGLRRVLLLLRDPADRPPLAAGRLQDLFGLTPAEARLALRLYDGEELAAASAALGISRHTARSHLNAILDKTETNRQAELLRRLAGIAELG